MEDLQTFTIHASTGSDSYTIDIERSLTARGGDVTVTVPTGLVIPLKKLPQTLNVSPGAAEINVGESFISAFEHSASTAHPSQWLSDDKMVIASPFLKNEGKLEAGKPARFLYRLIIHKEQWSKDRIEQEQSRFKLEQQQ